MPAPREAVDRRRSVVYLETAPQPAFETPPPGRAVARPAQRELRAARCSRSPSAARVEFPNSDRVYHNVFSLSKPRRFDLGRYPRGQSRSVVFDRPGVVRVFCEIHSHMSAFILVFAHRFFAVTDAEGRYRIEGVPPGSYTLALWNEGGGAPAPGAARRARRSGRAGPGGGVMARPLASLRSRVFAATAVVAVLPVAAAFLFVTRRVAQQAEVELDARPRRGRAARRAVPRLADRDGHRARVAGGRPAAS